MPTWLRQLVLPGLALGALLGLMFGSKLVPQLGNNTPISQRLAVPNCDLNQRPCAVTLPNNASLTLNITPRPLPTLQTLSVQLDVTGWQMRAASIDFLGADMEMGLNQSTLHPVPASATTSNETNKANPSTPNTPNTQTFLGKSSLPICVTGAMKWRAELQLDGTDGTKLTIPFEFVSGGH